MLQRRERSDVPEAVIPSGRCTLLFVPLPAFALTGSNDLTTHH